LTVELYKDATMGYAVKTINSVYIFAQQFYSRRVDLRVTAKLAMFLHVIVICGGGLRLY
jgi:hypothetical protein